LIANAAPAERQGEVQGANQAQQAIARTAGPLVAAWLYGIAASAPYAVAAMIVLAAAVALSRKS
jgi:DHA1 family tetracycline resistance protein-like MFS transporter